MGRRNSALCSGTSQAGSWGVPICLAQILSSIMDISGPDTAARRLDHHREADRYGMGEMRRYSPGPGCP